jgi:serine protease Do
MRWIAVFLALLAAAPMAAEPPDIAALVRSQAAVVVNLTPGYAPPPVLPDVPHDESLEESLMRLASELEAGAPPPSLGSGFIVSHDGYVVTSYHVLEDAEDNEVVARLADGRELPARVVGMDRATDIALLKLDARGLPSARIGDPATLQPGDWVASIGAPFGLEQSVAAGIVSAVRRAIPSESSLRFIQSDVALNPGASGGPLFNLGGEVVGVNSLIFSNTGGSIGLSFAVPIDAAMQVVEALRVHGKVTRGRLGVRLQELTPELAAAFGVARGALVADADRDGPARRAGIRAGDIVVSFGGQPVASHEALLRMVAAARPGSTVPVSLVRDRTPMRLQVRVEDANPPRPAADVDPGVDRFGLRLAALDPEQQRRLVPEGGVLVERAQGLARRAGLAAGDIVVGANGAATRSPASLRAALEQALPGESVALLVARGGRRSFIPLRVP